MSSRTVVWTVSLVLGKLLLFEHFISRYLSFFDLILHLRQEDGFPFSNEKKKMHAGDLKLQPENARAVGREYSAVVRTSKGHYGLKGHRKVIF